MEYPTTKSIRLKKKKVDGRSAYVLPNRTKVVSCIELMRALTEAIGFQLNERLGEGWTDMEYIFDSVTGMFMVKGAKDGEEFEEFMTFEDLGSYNLTESKFVQPEDLRYSVKFDTEDITTAVSLDADEKDFYDYLTERIESELMKIT